jgi:hypothetical protein
MVVLSYLVLDGTTNTVELMLTYMQMHGVAELLINYVYDAGYINIEEFAPTTLVLRH